MVGQVGPGLPGLAGLPGLNSQDFDVGFAEVLLNLAGVKRGDVGVGDDRVAMGRSDLAGDPRDLGDQARGDPDRRGAESDCLVTGSGASGATYQVTSPAPLSTLARRAKVNNKSDSRFR